MAVDITTFVRELRAFDGRREVAKQLRKAVRGLLTPARREVRGNARAMLPHRGGLNRWVASIGVLAKFRFTGRSAGVRIVGGRNSKGGRSDIRRIDRGAVRAPSWGRRGIGQWHVQAVPAHFFTKVLDEGSDVRSELDQGISSAIDDAFRTIRG